MKWYIVTQDTNLGKYAQSINGWSPTPENLIRLNRVWLDPDQAQQVLAVFESIDGTQEGIVNLDQVAFVILSNKD